MKKYLILIFLYCCFIEVSYGFCPEDSLLCRVYFRVGSSSLDLSFSENSRHLDSLLSHVSTLQKQDVLHHVSLISSASPEGDSGVNLTLSDKRCNAVRSYLQEHLCLPDSVFVSSSLGQAWDALACLVKDSDIPYREEALHILHNTPEWIIQKNLVVDSRKRQLMTLRQGDPWRYMVAHLFPELRSCSILIYKSEPVCPSFQESERKEVQVTEPVVPYDTIAAPPSLHDTVYVPSVFRVRRSFDMAVKTNMLYDVLLVPNIGMEFYLGKGWSLGGNWMYAWWKRDHRHRYWRLYGGELDIRRYFGRCTTERPLTGHHLGLCGQLFTYDFETGGTGYMGGKPGGTLWEKMNYAVGLEYGYSLPVTRRLNLDFVISVGYWGGEYHKYAPIGDCYVWKETRQRHWFGPTKAEISLVWLIGRDYCNKKGGAK